MSNIYPIRELARLTGVNPVTLRAWERRYGIIIPERTAKGHRYYTDVHLEQVRHILYWLDQGYPIRQVRMLLEEAQQPVPQDNDDWPQLQQQVLLAARHLNSQRLDDLWNQGFASYPLAVYYERCLQPVMQQLRSGSEQPLVLKCFEALLKRKLGSIAALQRRHNRGPLLLLAATHEQAELETLACACALGAAEIRVEYFSSNLQPNEVMLAREVINAQQLWIHFHPLPAAQQHQWLEYLENSKFHHCLSGAVPCRSNLIEHAEIMPGSLSQQVRHYINQSRSKIQETPRSFAHIAHGESDLNHDEEPL